MRVAAQKAIAVWPEGKEEVSLESSGRCRPTSAFKPSVTPRVSPSASAWVQVTSFAVRPSPGQRSPRVIDATTSPLAPTSPRIARSPSVPDISRSMRSSKGIASSAAPPRRTGTIASRRDR